ncbi:hypothetical protein [Microbacterium trichothecenolyticum]|uniref:Sap-like sulfolipid-1-addressing protein n=1 Tax=Microbacterium trichothecenolyticum TaxID=69370 RepID=A0ABU0TZ27_MICTR|nr:hypothetical protein [Microbacterium trichothecenolyticum]MDQ1124914.1 hypothetical protein [Microbacterium trichothecenolyticum]
MDDIARWAAALMTMIGLGLTLGLNPALYGATAEMLAQNTRIAARMAWMIGGLASGATLLYVLLQSFDPAEFVAVAQRRTAEAVLDRRVDLTAGALFLVGAAAMAWWKVRVPIRPRARTPAKSRSRSWSYYVLGISCSVIGFTTLPIMYMTGRVADGVSDHPLLRWLAYAVFLVALAAPFVLLATAWVHFPTTAARVNRVYTRVIDMDHRWVYAAVLGVAGVACLVLGVMPWR